MYSVDLNWNIHTYKHTSRAGQASGGRLKRKKSNKPIECAQGDQPARCPNRGFCVQQSSAVPSGGGVFVWCDVVTSGEMWCLPGNVVAIVLQSTWSTPYYKYKVVLHTTKNYSVLHSTTKYESVLQSTTKHNFATHETSSTLGGATCRTQNKLKLWHSCLLAATYELRRATYGMQSTLELRRACLIAATHEVPVQYAEQIMGCETHWNCHIPVLPRTSDTWSAQYIARSNRSHPSTFPNVAPWQEKQSQQSSNINKFFCPATRNHRHWQMNPRARQKHVKRPMRGRSHTIQTMLRPWPHHLAPTSSPRLLFPLWRCILHGKCNMTHSGYLPNFSTCCACHENLHCNFTRCACHEKWCSNITKCAPATKSDIPTSPNAAAKSDTPTSPNDAPATKSDIPTSPHVAPRGVMWMMRDVGDVWCEWCVMWVMWVMCECFEWFKNVSDVGDVSDVWCEMWWWQNSVIRKFRNWILFSNWVADGSVCWWCQISSNILGDPPKWRVTFHFGSR